MGCGCCGNGFCFGQLMYILEKIAAFCAMSAIISCIIVTVLVSIGLGVGIGYNYCFVDLKTSKLSALESYKSGSSHAKLPKHPNVFPFSGESANETATTTQNANTFISHPRPPAVPTFPSVPNIPSFSKGEESDLVPKPPWPPKQPGQNPGPGSDKRPSLSDDEHEILSGHGNFGGSGPDDYGSIPSIPGGSGSVPDIPKRPESQEPNLSDYEYPPGKPDKIPGDQGSYPGISDGFKSDLDGSHTQGGQGSVPSIPGDSGSFPDIPNPPDSQGFLPSDSGFAPDTSNSPSDQDSYPGIPGPGSDPDIPNVPGSQDSMPSIPSNPGSFPDTPNIPDDQDSFPGVPGGSVPDPDTDNIPGGQESIPSVPGDSGSFPDIHSPPGGQGYLPIDPEYAPDTPNIPNDQGSFPGIPSGSESNPHVPNIPSDQISIPSDSGSFPDIPSSPGGQEPAPNFPDGQGIYSDTGGHGAIPDVPNLSGEQEPISPVKPGRIPNVPLGRKPFPNIPKYFHKIPSSHSKFGSAASKLRPGSRNKPQRIKTGPVTGGKRKEFKGIQKGVKATAKNTNKGAAYRPLAPKGKNRTRKPVQRKKLKKIVTRTTLMPTIVIPLKKYANMSPLISQILAQNKNVTLQFITL